MGWLDLFQTGNLNNSTAVTQQTGDKAVTVSNQHAVTQEMQSLSPGDILSGKVTETNGDQVKLLVNLLSGNAEIDAKLSQNIALALGKNISFQVKSNGNGLMLSPLFENMGMEENGKKALSMAGIPENEKSLLLVSDMMKEGISIDKNTISEYYHQAVQHADADILDIIDLHRINLPVTQDNLEQIASYKNMTHQLSGAINNMAQELPGALQQMLAQGKEGEAARLFSELLKDIAGQYEGDTQEVGLQQLLQGPKGTEVAEQILSKLELMLTNSNEGAVETGGSSQTNILQQAGNLAELGDQLSEQAKIIDGEGVDQSASDLMANASKAESLSSDTIGKDTLSAATEETNIQQNNAQSPVEPSGTKQLLSDIKDLLQQLQDGTQKEEHVAKTLSGLLGKKEGRELLQKMFSENLRIRPEETDREGVKKLFQSMDKQLQNLSQALESANLSDSNLGKMVQSTQQNLDFLEQINQMYAYMQLPIKLTGRDANSDLYVYTNKKNLSSAEGEISAFLHLDMEHLGPVDCMVRMQDQKVSTRFTLQDDEMLDFLQSHIDILTERLSKRGYDMNVKMSTFDQKEQEDSNTVFKELIMRQSNIPGASNLSFDVKA